MIVLDRRNLAVFSMFNITLSWIAVCHEVIRIWLTLMHSVS